MQLAAKALNHLLAQNSWALLRLARFARKTIRIKIVPFSFSYAILENGTLCSADAEAGADAICEIVPSLLPRLVMHDEKAHAEIRSGGDAALLAEIFYLVRNLRWDAAEDLSCFTGDIAAERIVQTVQARQQQACDKVLNLSQAAAEYGTEKHPLLAKSQQIARFGQQVNALRDDIAQLEQRIKRLLAKEN